MNAPGRTMRPLPYSSIGAAPEVVTRDHLADQINRIQAIGRSPVGQEAARRMLAMIDRYAETFRSLPAQRTVPDMRQSPPNTAEQEQQLAQLRELAANRGTALREANERVAELNAAVAAAKADAASMLSQLDELREAARRANPSADEVDAAWAEARRVTLELESARRDMDILAWLHAEAVHQLVGAHAAADYCAAQATRRTEELDLVRGEALRLVEQLQAQREDLLHVATRFRIAWHSARNRAIARRVELAQVTELLPCDYCDGTGIAPSERFGRNEDGAPMQDGDAPCPKGCLIRPDIAAMMVDLRESQDENRHLSQEAERLRAAFEVEVARLKAELDSQPTPILRPSLILTDEQIEQLRAELAEYMDEHDAANLDPETSKRCSTCKLVKSLDEFYVRSSADPTHRHASCKVCDNERRRSAARRAAQENSRD